MSIGGIAASDDVWAEVDSDWWHILHNHDPRAEYMHMVEAIPLRGAFSKDKGWDDDKVFGLVNLLLSYLSDIPHKGKYCHFAVSLKMDDYPASCKPKLSIDCRRPVAFWPRSESNHGTSKYPS